MSLTTASLHILLPSGSAGARAALASAYRALGFVPPPPAAPAAREAVLAPIGDFLSVYDSACARSDDGTLRTLAHTLSAALRTCVFVTTVQDSEDFEFILFHDGRQVDSAVGDMDGHPGGLRAVRGPEQADLWRAVLGPVRFSTITHRASDDAADPVSRFVAIAGAAARASHRFAEDRLAAWCRMAQLPARAALRQFADAAASPGSTRLALAPVPARSRPTPPKAASLIWYRSDNEYPYHNFFPAAWPAEAGADVYYVWPVICRHRGVRRLRLALHIDRAGDFVPVHILITAFSARHGQIISPAPLASFGQSVPGDVGRMGADLAFDAEPFVLPDPTEEAGHEYMVLVRVELHIPASGEALITPSLRADGTDTQALILPTLRLAATRVAWLPVVADPLEKNALRRQAVLRLNTPAALTHVAILPDTGQEVRDSIRNLIETWLLPMTDTPLLATIRTEKHFSPDGAGSAADTTEPLATLLQGQLWPKLFRAARDLQNLRVEIGAADAPHMLAGFSLYSSLRDGAGPPADPDRADGPTLAASIWAIADETALSLLRLNIVEARAAFADWVRAAAPLQAWMAECAWIPAFDHYESYAVTLYEAAARMDWVGEDLVGTLCDRAWLRRKLRFVAPQMWLGWELASIIDATKLTAVADVTACADGVEVLLRRRRDLAKLERLLAPVLPMKC
jgi:hypothetical protein